MFQRLISRALILTPPGDGCGLQVIQGIPEELRME
jgi:hypothetical protein